MTRKLTILRTPSEARNLRCTTRHLPSFLQARIVDGLEWSSFAAATGEPEEASSRWAVLCLATAGVPGATRFEEVKLRWTEFGTPIPKTDVWWDARLDVDGVLAIDAGWDEVWEVWRKNRWLRPLRVLQLAVPESRALGGHAGTGSRLCTLGAVAVALAILEGDQSLVERIMAPYFAATGRALEAPMTRLIVLRQPDAPQADAVPGAAVLNGTSWACFSTVTGAPLADLHRWALLCKVTDYLPDEARVETAKLRWVSADDHWVEGERVDGLITLEGECKTVYRMLRANPWVHQLRVLQLAIPGAARRHRRDQGHRLSTLGAAAVALSQLERDSGLVERVFREAGRELGSYIWRRP